MTDYEVNCRLQEVIKIRLFFFPLQIKRGNPSAHISFQKHLIHCLILNKM